VLGNLHSTDLTQRAAGPFFLYEIMINNLIAKSYMDKKLAELLNPILEDLGFEMVRVRLSNGNPSTLQIMADRLDGQIGVDELAEINTSVGTILDVEDPIPENYTLEISSPGIDRPLTRKKDFDSFQGFEAKVETTELIDGRRRFRGVLAGVNNDEVLINLEEGTIGLKFTWLSDARLVLSDDLIKKMLKKNTKAGILNEENFDEIETQLENNEE
jgi:ribosome maturation factor RimP